MRVFNLCLQKHLCLLWVIHIYLVPVSIYMHTDSNFKQQYSLISVYEWHFCNKTSSIFGLPLMKIHVFVSATIITYWVSKKLIQFIKVIFVFYINLKRIINLPFSNFFLLWQLHNSIFPQFFMILNKLLLLVIFMFFQRINIFFIKRIH